MEYLPTASLMNLQRRAILAATVRQFFVERGYWEVETPILSSEMVLDAWLEPFVARWLTDPPRWATGGEPRYLQTSPEAHMKRLLAAGAQAIFQFSRVFRNGELGTRHNPEFTMLEWYRVGEDHHQQMTLVEQLVQSVFQVSQPWRTHASLDTLMAQPFERLAYDDAFACYAGQPVLSKSTRELIDLALQKKLSPPNGLSVDDRDGWLNFLLAELVEPHLGRDHPTFLHSYPASQAALAKVSTGPSDAPKTASRFELYVQGVELCNGYHELTDPVVLEARMKEQASLREEAGLRPLPEARKLLAAMSAGLPESSGVALGFDRLVMLALGTTQLSDVIAFPFERA